MRESGRFESGSFFGNIPPGADVYTIRHIIHDWQEAESLRILGNVRTAIKSDAKLLILKAVIPEGNDQSSVKVSDMGMMVWPNGVERRAEEYRALLHGRTSI